MALMPVCSGSFTGCRVDQPRRRGRDRPEPVLRPAEGVHHAADERRPDGHLEDAARPAHLVPLAEVEVVAEDDGADVVLFQVERLPDHRLARRRGAELEHLAGERLRETVHERDAVLDLQDGTDLLEVGDAEVGRLDLAQQDFLQFTGSQSGFVGH
jgi:hypothetical protein